jgi:hypothetical protein
MNTRLFLSILPFVVLVVLAAGFVVVFRQRAGARRSSRPPVLADPEVVTRVSRSRADRPWWGSPWMWLGVSAMFLLLGLLVWPGLIGGTILFLPFVWISRSRRVGQPDPRSNGHGSPSGGLRG